MGLLGIFTTKDTKDTKAELERIMNFNYELTESQATALIADKNNQQPFVILNS